MCVSKQRPAHKQIQTLERGFPSLSSLCAISFPEIMRRKRPLIILFKIPWRSRSSLEEHNHLTCLLGFEGLPTHYDNLIDCFFAGSLHCFVVVAVAAGVLEWWHPFCFCRSEQEFSRSCSGSQSSRRRHSARSFWNGGIPPPAAIHSSGDQQINANGRITNP